MISMLSKVRECFFFFKQKTAYEIRKGDWSSDVCSSDLGVVDRLGDGISGIEPGQIVAALPIHGAYAEFVCLPQRELVPVPSGLDAAEAVSLVLNYVTAYQMLHRSAHVRPGQRALIHGAT